MCWLKNNNLMKTFWTNIARSFEHFKIEITCICPK